MNVAGGELGRHEDRSFLIWNGVVSVTAVAFLAWLLLVPHGVNGSVDLSFLPAVNASLNSLCAVLLVSAWVAIKLGKIGLHKRLTVGAFATSALFLISYVVYHYVHGDTKYGGEGPLRIVYFAVLISHVLLSMTIVPMALYAFYLAFQERFERHAQITRKLMPIWLYVSVTGVVIYFMLKR